MTLQHTSPPDLQELVAEMYLATVRNEKLFAALDDIMEILERCDPAMAEIVGKILDAAMVKETH